MDVCQPARQSPPPRSFGFARVLTRLAGEHALPGPAAGGKERQLQVELGFLPPYRAARISANR